jgi:hypothetical protein
VRNCIFPWAGREGCVNFNGAYHDVFYFCLGWNAAQRPTNSVSSAGRLNGRAARRVCKACRVRRAAVELYIFFRLVKLSPPSRRQSSPSTVEEWEGLWSRRARTKRNQNRKKEKHNKKYNTKPMKGTAAHLETL